MGRNNFLDEDWTMNLLNGGWTRKIIRRLDIEVYKCILARRNIKRRMGSKTFIIGSWMMRIIRRLGSGIY